MAEEQFEYDIAVSFAGEQRDYVRSVVRGLGDDIKVFYDEDHKAKLLGENLIDLLTDLYQNKARYVAMFVSAAYREKMWPNVERQSAMARAAAQRSAYLLPIRMDDTELPGLLSTVGFVDSRIEGLDGVIKILAEKLGTERATVEYAGRVPETQSDIELLLALRPDFWEYWLYAGVLRVGLAKLEDKYRDYEIGFAKPNGEIYRGEDAYNFLRTAPDMATVLMRQFNAVTRQDVQARAFGAPGEPGDPDRITHMAQRLLDVYESFMDEAGRLRGAAVPDEFADAQAAAAMFASDPIEKIRSFVSDCVSTMNRLPEIVEAHQEGDEPQRITLGMTLELDDAVSQAFVDGMAAGVKALNG